MPQVSSSSLASLPQPFESSSLRSYRDRDDGSRQWERIRQLAADNHNLRQAVTRLNQQFRMSRRRILGGGTTATGWTFQSPRELDPTASVAAQVVVYISPNNPLVTSGLYDIVSGETITAIAGLWVAVQDVPAQTTITVSGSSVTAYNMPQLPYPGAGGTPSSHPYMGDLDGVNVFWAFISQAPVCV